MEVELPNGHTITGVPEGATKEDIKRKAIAGGLATEDTFRKISKPLEFAGKIAQGATFGFGDELSAALVGAMAELTGVGSFQDAYADAIENIRANQRAFEEQEPALAMGAEVGGAALTGGLAGGRALQGVSKMSPLGRTARISGVGATEGGLYGAGSADDDRLQGAATGAVAGAVLAPVGAKVIDMALRGATSIGRFANRKLTEAPQDTVARMLRERALEEGIDADDAVRLLDEMGPEATLADLGENFRMLARGARGYDGSFRATARNTLESRQMGQQGRLLNAAEVAAGKRAGDFNTSRRILIDNRKTKAGPLYESAFAIDPGKPSVKLLKLMDRPTLKAAMAKANKLASDEGVEIGESTLLRLHYSKMALDDLISTGRRQGNDNRVRILTSLKHELLDQMDAISPDYKAARDIWSGESSMIDAMDQGLDLFKTSVDDLSEAVGGMTASEKELFQLGATRAIKDVLDNTNLTQDATRKLLQKQKTRDQLAFVFDDPEDFIRTAVAESEFSRTRNAVLMGSQTDVNLGGQRSVREGIQIEDISGIASKDPVAMMRTINKIFSSRKVTPEVVEEMAQTMLQKGMNEAQIRKVFATPSISKRLGDMYYDDIVLPAIRGGTVPGYMATQ